MIVREIGSPIPIPWGLVVKNGSKSCPSFSVGTPWPESRTAISIIPFWSSRAWTATWRDPSGRALTASIRQLWGNPNPFAAAGFPAEHPIELTLAWVAIMLAVFAPLAVWRYRSISR